MKRSPLRRVTPLRTTKLGVRPSKPVAGTRRPQRRETGPTAATRLLVLDRAGYMCERCGSMLALHLHHRKLRRAGDHSAAALFAVCVTCHEEIHHSPALSMAHGWIVSQHQDPAQVPVTYRDSIAVLLSLDGSKVPA